MSGVFLSHSTLYFKTKSLIEPGAQQLGRLASQSQGFSCVFLSMSSTTGVCSHFLLGGWGLPAYMGKYFSCCAISLPW